MQSVYDIYGNLTTLSNGSVTYSYGYDLKGRLTFKTDSRNSKTLSWEYDAVGNVIKKTDYQSEVRHYQYVNSNRLVTQGDCIKSRVDNTAIIRSSSGHERINNINHHIFLINS